MNELVIRIRYFARLCDQLDCSDEQFAMDSSGCLVAELKQKLAGRGENWKKAMELPSLLVAVNQVLADDQTQLHLGDEVGFFPPVTGG